MENTTSENKEPARGLEELIRENLKLTKEIHEMTRGIKSFVLWQRVFGVVKILIIAVPIALGIIYLPPLLRELVGQYRSVLQMAENPLKNVLENGEDLQLPGFDLKSIIQGIKK